MHGSIYKRITCFLLFKSEANHFAMLSLLSSLAAKVRVEDCRRLLWFVCVELASALRCESVGCIRLAVRAVFGQNGLDLLRNVFDSCRVGFVRDELALPVYDLAVRCGGLFFLHLHGSAPRGDREATVDKLPARVISRSARLLVDVFVGLFLV